MTTVTQAAAGADETRTGTATGRTATGRVTIERVISAELVKIRTTRSAIAATVTAALLVAGVGTFAAVGTIVQDTPDAATADPLGGSLTGVSAAVYAVAALGVLAATSEYTTGTIKPTLAAVPRRLQLVLGKAAAVAVTTAVIMLAALFGTFFAARAIVATDGVSISLTEPGVARVLVGAALYLTGVAVLGVGFGWLLRSTAGAVAVLVGVLVVPPIIGLLLPRPVGAAVLPYLPDNAGTAMMQLNPGGQLDPGVGLAVFSGYVAVTLASAAYVVRRRDA